MRTVLYAHDMEPITILELEEWQLKCLRDWRQVRLMVEKPIDLESEPSAEIPEDLSCWIVNITAENLHRNGERHLMLFTHDEEASMLLKGAFLPGQRWMLDGIKREAFAEGFLAALARLR